MVAIVPIAFLLTACGGSNVSSNQTAFNGEVTNGNFTYTDNSWTVSADFANGHISLRVNWTEEQMANRKIVHSHSGTYAVRVEFIQTNQYGSTGSEIVADMGHTFTRDWSQQSGIGATIIQPGEVWID